MLSGSLQGKYASSPENPTPLIIVKEQPIPPFVGNLEKENKSIKRVKVPQICGIYKIISPTNSIYIGQANHIYYRWSEYKARRCKEQQRLYFSLKKHGPENHIFEIVEICSKENLDEREMHYIELFKTFNTEHGLNLTQGGIAFFKNKRHRKESKDKISAAGRFRKKSREEVERTRQKNLGQKRTPEQKQRIEEGKKNNPRGPHPSKGIKKGKMTGKALENVIAANKRNASRKKTASELTKLSESNKRTWAKKVASIEFNSLEEKEKRREGSRKGYSTKNKNGKYRYSEQGKANIKLSWIKRKEESARIKQEKLTMIF